MITTMFSPVCELIPHNSKRDKSTAPVTLVCTKALQIIPWELLLGDVVVRHFTLHDFLKVPRSSNAEEHPQLFCFFSSNADKKFLNLKINEKNLH